MINLKRFTQKQEAIVPIINNQGQYQSRKFTIQTENGWYKLLFSDKIKILKEADGIEVAVALLRLPKVKGYCFGDSIVPIHFNIANSETIKVYFMQAELWQIVETRKWENGQLFYRQLDDLIDPTPIISVKKRFEEERNLEGLKYITPEMRYLFILASLEREQYKEIEKLKQLKISEEEKKKRLAEFHNTIGGRLSKIMVDVGAHLVRFHKKGSHDLIVVWRIGNEEFNSVIKADNLYIKEAGFCLSGDDNKHSLSSAVLLAKEYQRQGLIYKTRD